jgi:transmembrane serine protease 11D
MKPRICNRLSPALGALAVAGLTAWSGLPASAQPTPPPPPQEMPATVDTAGEPVRAEPWMRDFVRLRLAERNLSAVRSATPTGRAGAAADDLVQPRIVGGIVSPAGDNPFQVALLQRNVPNNQQAQFCGGTLVRENFVVTAAHCSDFLAANQAQVLTGTRRLDGTGVRRNVVRIVIHPQWNRNTFDHDVAVWQLETNATGSPLATLATADPTTGTNLLATGWGALGEGLPGSIDLRSVTVPMVDRNNCNDANSYNGQITDRMICAGRDQGGVDTCQGDSGGPLATGAVLTGITSWGNGCARANLFGVYARVSNPVIRNFIVNTINPPPAVAAVQCRVFNDGYTSASGTTDAIYIRNNRQACKPDGSASGTCRKWLGLCTTQEAQPRAVRFRVFDNGDSNQAGPSDAVYLAAPNVSCIPDGTPQGRCRRWFGLPQTDDGRNVSCRLFNDGYTSMTGPTRAIYYRSPGRVCMPDGTATGTCRKWFGRCEAR